MKMQEQAICEQYMLSSLRTDARRQAIYNVNNMLCLLFEIMQQAIGDVNDVLGSSIRTKSRTIKLYVNNMLCCL